MKKGIDISSYQDNIDWNKINTDFIIIRLGYGDDLSSQDDKLFKQNVAECIKKNIPFGVYIYSYATNLKGEASIESEVNHCKRLLNSINKKPFCVYIDMEDSTTIKLGKNTLTNYAIEFCKQIESLGYKAGVYANENWFKNYLDSNSIKNKGYSLWVAKYSEERPSIDSSYDIWQYTNKGEVSGIYNSEVDMDYMLNDIIKNEPNNNPTKNNEIIYQIWDDVKNIWLSNVINDTDYAGIFGHDVCCVYASTTKGNVYYKVHTKGIGWLPEVKNRMDYAGLYNKPIDGFMIKSDTQKLTYRVHLRRTNRWLPWVTGYNTNDANNGYAGIINQEIDGIQIKFN